MSAHQIANNASACDHEQAAWLRARASRCRSKAEKETRLRRRLFLFIAAALDEDRANKIDAINVITAQQRQ